MNYYAQLNESRRVVVITQASGAIDHPLMVSIPEYDESLLGKIHNLETGEFEAPPLPVDTRPEIEIKSIESDNPTDFQSVRLGSGRWDVTCRAGATLTVTAELEIAGAKLNASEQFRMPMRARGSGRTIVLLAKMVAGVITITARMDESEIWEVLEQAINEALPIDEQMRFDGLTIQTLQAV